MTRAFWLGLFITSAIVLAAIAWMSINANDDAHERRKADVDAGRWP